MHGTRKLGVVGIVHICDAFDQRIMISIAYTPPFIFFGNALRHWEQAQAGAAPTHFDS
jgi:hypothetical protein